jgi:hypothetical protein
LATHISKEAAEELAETVTALGVIARALVSPASALEAATETATEGAVTS